MAYCVRWGCHVGVEIGKNAACLEDSMLLIKKVGNKSQITTSSPTILKLHMNLECVS